MPKTTTKASRQLPLDALDELKRCRDVAKSPGFGDYNKYMRGVANGLALAVSIIEGTEPEFMPAPNAPSEAKLAALTEGND
ncbi:hypothetical protein EOA32_00835 [Mesorhizobium sp. M1A.F.Ca.ET.072.01.1.1]|uniref:hypothetical protein n=1 Tax=Mesorhizobium sp. M1A.F.Ca.ET.072.01.1.1 TaxID=2496753 RepID=UPI000FD274CA|nr:hypothetical protein [Mesorhizobium sp. M1A.F.Ca.ET.072.01.1.1]RUW55597.1 hypothetical protein EOA32_00835 [Mesorhizobium sp. M1A.F.Ca.ET.072.01.1.1]